MALPLHFRWMEVQAHPRPAISALMRVASMDQFKT